MARNSNEMSASELLIFLDLCKRTATIIAGDGKDLPMLESTADLREIITKFESGYKEQVATMAKTIEMLKERLHKIESGEFKK